MNKINVNYTSCTGCSACENICPVSAITMEPDREGFLYPNIRKEKCIYCGQCVKVCHNYMLKPRTNRILKCYAAWAADEIRARSSSGGVFTLISEYILTNRGYVCGASFEENMIVKHIIIDKNQELEKLQTSKYVQSRIATIFKEIKELLDNNKTVLFSGTPCQVGGLYHYLGYEPENLYTIDLMCHGVPPQSLFDKYLSEEHQGEYIKLVNFRDKCVGWTYKLKLKVVTEKDTYITDINEDTYYKAFNSRLSLRKSCGFCEFANSSRMGDISLGDFWEIWEYDKELDDRKGTSLVLLNSEKGKTIFQKIIPKLQIAIEVPVENAMKGNATLYRNIPLHENRDCFFKDIYKYSLREAVEKNIEKRNCSINKKCAIFNYWWAWRDAHGASLTALALYQLVEELGYDPCLIMSVFGVDDIDKCKSGRHFRFISKYAKYSEKNYCMREEYEELNKEFQYFIVGSDQVLRVEWVPDEWFLYPIRSDKTKIVMSGSFGGNILSASEKRINRVANYLKDFSAVSVRELDGIEVYNRYFGHRADIEWIMDPVFLINPIYYNKLINNRSKNVEIQNYEKEVIFFYILDNTSELVELKNRICDKYDVIILEDNQNLMAEDFLHIVANCKMVITDSFHGMCFAIIFNKPFYCIYNKMRGTSRIDTIKKIFLLEDVILDIECIDTCDFAIPEIDYAEINKIIKRERKKGRNWLKEKLEFHIE